MLTKIIVNSPKAPPAVGPYNHAVRVGHLLYCSGQIPIDPANPGAPFPPDIKGQTEWVLQNIQAVLDHEKLVLSNVAKTTVFMTDLREFAEMNEIYARYFPLDFPARSTVQVAALPKGARIEIEVVAFYPNA
jgi:2-iminobutanoate/2-iminopropanoate deaminase